jgi:putative FmdB family regulatory protein
MPTYRYRRPDGTTFEVFQKISDAPLTEDPETGVPVHRVISGGAGLQFKGSGFYLTDYTDKGKPSKKEPASESSGGEKKASGESGTKATAASGD